MSQYDLMHQIRIKIVLLLNIIAVVFIIGRLFFLQVVQFETITQTSESTRTGEMQLLANRGNIYLKDFHSNQKFYLATNTTFGRIIADPTLITTPQTIVDKLTPVLFNLEKEKEENINYINDIKKSIQKEQLEKNNVRLTPF